MNINPPPRPAMKHFGDRGKFPCNCGSCLRCTLAYFPNARFDRDLGAGAAPEYASRQVQTWEVRWLIQSSGPYWRNVAGHPRAPTRAIIQTSLAGGPFSLDDHRGAAWWMVEGLPGPCLDRLDRDSPALDVRGLGAIRPTYPGATRL